MPGALHCFLPARMSPVPVDTTLVRLIAAAGCAQTGNFRLVSPQSGRESRTERRADSCRLERRGDVDGYAEQVTLKLHEPVVHGRTPVDAQLGDRTPRRPIASVTSSVW